MLTNFVGDIQYLLLNPSQWAFVILKQTDGAA